TRLSKGQSHFTQMEILRAVAEESQCRALSAQEVITRVGVELEHNPELVRLGSRDGELHFTTQKNLDLEKSLLPRLERSKADVRHMVSADSVHAAVVNRPTMTEEQVQAVVHLTRRQGSVQCLTGMAGTGKSFVLGAVREVLEAEGYEVLGGALAGKAA